MFLNQLIRTKQFQIYFIWHFKKVVWDLNQKHIYKVVMCVCLIIIIHEPHDRFASSFVWGTQKNHGNVLSLVLKVLKFQVEGVDLYRANLKQSCTLNLFTFESELNRSQFVLSRPVHQLQQAGLAGATRLTRSDLRLQLPSG